jgi:oligopeptide transport system permease protein
VVRGSILSLRQTEFVDAARALGASNGRIMLRHLLPNFLGPVIVYETLRIPEYIVLEATLSFIGLGVNPPTPSWGLMINEGAQAMRSHPHLALYPAITLSLALMAFNFLGDGLRDALDPRMRR